MDTILISDDPVVTREDLFFRLYKQVFPSVARYVARRDGSFEEARDVFQDALVIYYEKLVGELLPAQHLEKAYIVGIARHLWLKRYREKSNYVGFDLLSETPEEEVSVPSAEILMRYLESSGKRCMELLKAFYYDKLPFKQLGRLFGYASIHSATVQKYKCLEKVRTHVKQKSLSYEDFVE